MMSLAVTTRADGVCWPVHLPIPQVEEIGGPHAPASDAVARRNDGGDAAARRLHAPEPETEEVLAGVAAFSGEVRGLDPVALQERFEARRAPDRGIIEIRKRFVLNDLCFDDRFCGRERLRRTHDERGARRRSGQKTEAATR